MKSNIIPYFQTMFDYAYKYTPQTTYQHSLRVMHYVMRNTSIPERIHDECIVVAIAHDLLEDGKITVFDLPDLPENVWRALELITHNKNQSYVDYVKDIVDAKNQDYGLIAYWVKMADMKDHLAQKDTLTDKLKTKYLEALPYLLP